MALRFSAKRGSLSTRVDRRLIPRKEKPVELNIVNEVAALQRLSVGQLRQRFAELFGETTNASNRTWLIKRIIWRMQALAEGDLSERARQRATELARDGKRLPPFISRDNIQQRIRESGGCPWMQRFVLSASVESRARRFALTRFDEN